MWLEYSRRPLSDYCNVNIGHVKHAFVLAFSFLRLGTKYETAKNDGCPVKCRPKSKKYFLKIVSFFCVIILYYECI